MRSKCLLFHNEFSIHILDGVRLAAVATATAATIDATPLQHH